MVEHLDGAEYFDQPHLSIEMNSLVKMLNSCYENNDVEFVLREKYSNQKFQVSLKSKLQTRSRSLR